MNTSSVGTLLRYCRHHYNEVGEIDGVPCFETKNRWQVICVPNVMGLKFWHKDLKKFVGCSHVPWLYPHVIDTLPATNYTLHCIFKGRYMTDDWYSAMHIKNPGDPL